MMMFLDQVSFQSVRREKVSEQISQQLLKAIVLGHIQVGEMLPPERELADLFNASRVAVREAIGTLTAKGIATSTQGKGTIINPREQWNSLDPQIFLLESNKSAFHQLMEVRRIIEPEMAALAADRITPTILDRLHTLIATHSDDSVEQHISDDVNFHLEIARASQNQVLLIIMNSINDLLKESRHRTYYIPDAPQRAWDFHADILRALETKDADAARRYMIDHLDQVRKDLELLE
jgi:GntR family transcriptional regulator, transcriptional repressor for pyruvate dehydrogenase complex